MALLDAAGVDRAHVVGHDWGGGVAWALAALHPDRVATLSVISTPHPGAMRQAMVHSTQGLHSWYMLAFQIPALPEWLIARSGPERIRTGLVSDGLGADAAAAATALLCDREAARAMINWYRALPFSAKVPIGAIGVPTTYIWSDHDRYLGRYAAEHTADWVTGPYRFVEIPGGTHWLPDTHPGQITDAVRRLAEETAAGATD